LLAMNDNAVCLADRGALIAGKHRSHRVRCHSWDLIQVWRSLLERGLPAMNDNAVCLADRGAIIAGQHRSLRVRCHFLECLVRSWRGVPEADTSAYLRTF